MHPLAATFASGQRCLAANPSVDLLADPTIPWSAKLVVVPTMAFWVLAFGDAMALLQATGGDTPHDALVRQHAAEDAEHWRWFLQDLESLATQGIGAASMHDAMLRQWGPATAAVRECAFTLQHLLRTHRDPVVRLALLEACEDGFAAFMDSMRPVVQGAGKYIELRYFGALHDDAEAGHTVQGVADPLQGVDWSTRDVGAVRAAVAQMYDRLDGMHTCYAEAIQAACERGTAGA